MIAGVSQALKPGGTRIIALEPDTSPVLTAGHGGPHRVEGMGVGFVPPHLTPQRIPNAGHLFPREQPRRFVDLALPLL